MNARAWAAILLVPILASIAVNPSPAQDAAGEDPVARLKKLGQACLRYAEHNGGSPPSSMAELYYKGYVDSLQDFVCPANPVEIAHRMEIDDKSGYILSPSAEEGGVRAVVQDRTAANNGGGGINVFYSDASVRWEAASASDGAGREGSATGVRTSIPLPVLGLSALLFGGGVFVAVLALRRKRSSPVPPGLSS